MRTTNAAFVVALVVALSGSDAPAQSTVASPDRPDSATKRCHAAQRRVERQQEVLGQLDARMTRDTQARARCEGKRRCERLDRVLKAHETRRTRYERQLAQYEAEAAKLCAAR